MELNLDLPQDLNFIRSIDSQGIRINNDYYHGSLVVSASHLVTGWAVQCLGDTNAENLQVIFDLQPELVLIGCGKTQAFLAPATQMLFLERHIGVEVMVTDAACRTFNLLAGDGRDVVAALIWAY